MVSELSACLGKRFALGNRGANLLLDCIDLFSRSENRLLVRVRQDHHAVGVSAQEIPGRHACVTYVDDRVDGFDLHAILPRAHRVAPAVDRISQLTRQMRVATGAIDHRACDTALMRDPGQNVAPHGRIFAPAVVQTIDALPM